MFRLLGSLLIAVWIIWIVVLLRSSPAPPAPAVLPIGSAFDDNPQIPVAEFKQKFATGVRVMNEEHTNALKNRSLSLWAEWLSFGLTSLITLIAGATGKTLQAPEKSGEPVAREPAGEAQRLESPAISGGVRPRRGHRSRAMVLVGFLAALASVSTGFSSRLKSASEEFSAASQEINSVLSTSRRDWYNGKNKEDALRVIEKLDAILLKQR